jgi:DNA-directed RNA polymerase specialized sigma24 family protein
METEELLSRAKNLRTYATIRYPMFRQDQLDDLVQWACEKWLNGRSLKQRNGHLIVDYMRQEFKEQVRNKGGRNPSIYKLVDVDKVPHLLKVEQEEEILAEIDKDMRSALILELLKTSLTSKEQGIMGFYLQGLNQREIGEKFDLIESSISLKLTVIFGKLKKTVKNNPRFAHLKDFL